MLKLRDPYSYQSDPRVPDFDDTGAVAVMDAQCGLCARGAAWIARNDTKAEFRIVPIQSKIGRGLATHFGVSPDDPSTWLVLYQGQAVGGIDAMLFAARRFGGIWRLVAVLRLVPRPIRDWIYAIVARNRYRVFGRADFCNLPDAEVQKRLLL